MDPLDALDALARRARLDRPPPTRTDVAALLAACRAQDSGDESRSVLLAWSAGISAIAAGLILILALRTSTATVDPVGSLFAPVQVQMP